VLAGVLASGCGLVGNEGERQAAVVSANCLDCHNETEQVAGLNLEAHSFDAVARDAQTWELVIRKLRAGLMPPADGGPTLDKEERAALVAWLENEIDGSAEPHLPAPGLHRLNRTESTRRRFYRRTTRAMASTTWPGR
jgi:mono/diheme cytochrome c family protein